MAVLHPIRISTKKNTVYSDNTSAHHFLFTVYVLTKVKYELSIFFKLNEKKKLNKLLKLDLISIFIQVTRRFL